MAPKTKIKLTDCRATHARTRATELAWAVTTHRTTGQVIVALRVPGRRGYTTFSIKPSAADRLALALIRGDGTGRDDA